MDRANILIIGGGVVGCAVARAVSRRWSDVFLVFDSLARYGGEEFVVVMPGTGADDAAVAAERLRVAVESLPFTWKPGHRCALTVSIGVACTPEHPITPEALLHAADVALYEAKRAGRNQVKIAAQASSASEPGST